MKRVQNSKVDDMFGDDMFEIPQPEQIDPGSSDYAFLVSTKISQILKEAHLDRYEISAQMSRLTGKDVSKNMIDAWASPARIDHNIPFHLLPVLEQICSSLELTNWLVRVRGGKACYGRDTLNATLGQAMLKRKELNAQIRQLKKVMGES